jgi:putative transposase
MSPFQLVVERAGQWPWSSDAVRATRQGRELLCDGPVDRPRNWSKLLEEKLAAKDLKRIRTSVVRGRPYGSDDWVQAAAERLDLAFTLRPRGRPKKEKG